MATTAAGDHQSVSMHARQAFVPLLAWCALGVALFAALVFWFDPARLLTSIGDTDDATRLIEVRKLMAGASWYDMTISRFGGAHPLVSHWSRLIDLPIAMLLSALELVLPPDKAELAVRTVWPLALLLVFVYVMARASEYYGGRTAARLSILLTVTCLIGVVQFLPGRIDHHNAIIICAVGGILLLARAFDNAHFGWGAGVVLGLGTAIGYEALALTTASLAAAVLYGLLPGRSLLAPSRAAVTFAATLAVALSLTTAPNGLFVSHCDALSINLVALAACGALGVSVVQALEDRLSLPAKVALLGVTGAIGVSLYAYAEPACLAGPFGQVDPALWPIWLGSVSETQSMLSLGSQLPFLGGLALLYFAAGTYCGVKLIRSEGNEALRFHMIAFLVSMPLSFWQIKLLPYATFLPVPLLAAALARPPQKDSAPIGKRTAVLTAIATLIAIGAGSWLLLSLAQPSTSRMKEKLKPVQACQSTAAIQPLAQLPMGLVVADVNLGPYIAVFTNLNVLSAPYHRLDKAIIAEHRIFNAAPGDAERRLRDVGARYVVVCEGLNSTTHKGAVAPDALQTLLLAGKPPAFLTPVPLGDATPLKVWRFNP